MESIYKPRRCECVQMVECYIKKWTENKIHRTVINDVFDVTENCVLPQHVYFNESSENPNFILSESTLFSVIDHNAST